MSSSELHNVRAVADALDTSVSTVLRRITLGEIVATKIGGGRTSAYVIEQRELQRLVREQNARRSQTAGA